VPGERVATFGERLKILGQDLDELFVSVAGQQLSRCTSELASRSTSTLTDRVMLPRSSSVRFLGQTRYMVQAQGKVRQSQAEGGVLLGIAGRRGGYRQRLDQSP
jgi:hypothetical protein